MANPVTTARPNPSSSTGQRFMSDGHSTKVALNPRPDLAIWEKTVTPPGVDGGDPIDITTMHNLTWRTMVSRSLRTLTPFTFAGLYDPKVYDDILDVVNVEGSITVHFPDGSTLDFFGFLQTFAPQEHVEGTSPEAQVTIAPTNYDNTNRAEAGPVMTEVAGT